MMHGLTNLKFTLRRTCFSYSCNSGDGTDQRVQSLMFMMMMRRMIMMMIMFQVTKKYTNIYGNSAKIEVIITDIYLCLISSILSIQMEELNGQQVS